MEASKGRKTGIRKKSPSVFGCPENIFEPMFTGTWYVFGISYPEKIGVSVEFESACAWGACCGII